MLDTTSGDGEQSDKVLENVEAIETFKSDGWKHFGFQCQEIRREKVTDQQTTIADTPRLRWQTWYERKEQLGKSSP